MADRFSIKKRSEIMSNIRGNETKPEIRIRKFLFTTGFRYRKNVKNLPGSPDIVLKKFNTIIFINGCFWHGHKNCDASKLPLTRSHFWSNKINRNMIRDKKNIRDLKNLGWKVVIIWQCQMKKNKMETLKKRLIKKLQ